MSNKLLRELDESAKDPSTEEGMEWMTQVVAHYRAVAKPLVDREESQEALTYLFGTHDMSKVRKMFKDPAESGLSFLPVAVLEKARNIFIAEVEEAGVEVHVKAADPTAFNERERDKALLSNRKIIEGLISKDQQAIGNPPYRIADDTGEDGQPLYSGNVERFDEMGLDENSSEDVAYFFQYWHRLNHEVKAEEPINAYLKLNDVESMLPLLVDDILAKKATCYQAYVNTQTGGIELKYRNPDNVKVVAGKRKRDFKDYVAVVNDEPVTVMEFLNIMGDDFNPETDMDALLSAVNLSATNLYTGIREDGCLCAGGEGNVIDMSDLMQEMVTLGYVEFKTNNGTAYKVARKNSHGNPAMRRVKLSKTISPNSIYSKEVYYNQVTYKAYYLATGANSQKLYRAGKLSYQEVEGAEDEYSNGSFVIMKEPGPTFVKMAIPWIELFEKTKAKWEYEIERVKPPGRSYSYDSLLQIATSLYPNQGPQDKMTAILSVIKMFTESPNEIHTIPEISGQPVGGGNGSSFELRNGFSNAPRELIATMEYCDQMIDRLAGMSQERDVEVPNPRASYRVQANTTNYSKKATRYIQRMIDGATAGMGRKVLYYVTDIIAYGDKATLAYKFMLRLLGDQTVNDLSTIKKVAMHRYALFVESVGMMQERAEIREIARISYERKEISAEQLYLIMSIRSPKRAMQIHAYEKQRNERMQQERFMQEMQAKDQLSAREHAREMELENLKIQGRVLERDTQGRWLAEAYKNNNETELIKEDKKLERELGRQAAKAESKIEEMTAEHTIKSQQPLV